MRKVVLLLVVGLTGLVFAGQASAATYYVAPGGTGLGEECTSPLTPCSSVSHVINHAQQSAGSDHWIFVSAVDDDGNQAVYQESIAVVPGPNTATFTINGSWNGEGRYKARFYTPAGGANGLMLVNQGSSVYNIEIDATRSTAAAISATPGPGEGGFILLGVDVKADDDQTGIYAGGLSYFHIHQSTVEAEEGRALDLQGVVSPRVFYSTFSSKSAEETVLVSGPTGVELVGTAVYADPDADASVRASYGGGTVRLESSLIVGGKAALGIAGGGLVTEVRSSTLDAGEPLVADPDAQAIAWEPGYSTLTGSITGSILLEQPLLPTTGSSGPSAVSCSNTDVPNTVQNLENGFRTLNCATGSGGNTHYPPSTLFDGTLPGAAAYTPRPGSPAIDTGEPFAEMAELDVLGNDRVRPGRSCGGAAIIDRGAVEASCTVPGFTLLKFAKKKVKKGKKAKLKVRTNTPARIDVKVGKVKAAQGLAKWKSGTNTLTVKTGKLKARKKPYKVKVTITDTFGVKAKATVKLRVK